jgi:hypothetical protein
VRITVTPEHSASLVKGRFNLLDGHCCSHFLDATKQCNVHTILQAAHNSIRCTIWKLVRGYGGHESWPRDVQVDVIDIIAIDLKMVVYTFFALCAVFFWASDDLSVVSEFAFSSEVPKVRVTFDREDRHILEFVIVDGDDADRLLLHDSSTVWGRRPFSRIWIKWTRVTSGDYHIEIDHQARLRSASFATSASASNPAISGIVLVRSIFGKLLFGQACKARLP